MVVERYHNALGEGVIEARSDRRADMRVWEGIARPAVALVEDMPW